MTEEQIAANADALIEMGYKKWRKERRQLRQQKKYATQEDRLREIEEDMLVDRNKEKTGET